jgi:pimeloyl-ACP methyl ester carboxylesterase
MQRKLSQAILTGLVLAGLLSACATPQPQSSAAIDSSRLPVPDVALFIPGLGPCTDDPDRTLSLKQSQPVTILVHGCFGSAGKFRALAQVLAFHGQQTACFSYDDRASLMQTSGRLATAVDTLAARLPRPEITVLGHSMGGLVARKALIADRSGPVGRVADLRLVTVSAPFAGIRAANTCANPLLRIGTLGLLDLSCWAVSGDKWHEITYASNFIRQPGSLSPNVRQHLKIATDEAQICRRQDEQGHCLADDFVFTLAEQYFPPVDSAPGVRALDLKAGHAGVIGETGEVPNELIAILQREDVIRPTEPERLSAFQAFLRRLYGS